MFYYLSFGGLREVKNKENFKLLALKVFMVAYEMWSFTRGSKYSYLTRKLLVLWKIKRWSLMTGCNQRFDYIYVTSTFSLLYRKPGKLILLSGR